MKVEKRLPAPREGPWTVARRSPGVLVLSILMISGLGCERSGEAVRPAAEPPGPVNSVPEETPPTILLTGFEPFGGFSRNASWEAVRRLDGERVEGVRLRAVLLPVRWGAPLPALREACERWRPVAVFGFGQGRAGAVRFERVADNERRSHPDNEGKPPPAKVIVEGGPPSFRSSFPFDEVMAAYDGPGIPVSDSTEAGGYLCEECFYALETVRKEAPRAMDVAFFHVPALASPWRVDGETKPCHEDALSAFVLGLVRAWIAAGAPR